MKILNVHQNCPGQIEPDNPSARINISGTIFNKQTPSADIERQNLSVKGFFVSVRDRFDREQNNHCVRCYLGLI